MRWGLIGTGLHAESRIAPALAATAHERLHGVVASTPAKAAAFAGRFGCIAYLSLEAMLADAAIEAVFVCTPNDQHRRQTELAAAAGKHVLVEKPMALTEADCQAMIDACRRAGVRLGIGFQPRDHPVHRELRRLITTGDLGEVVMLRAEWHTGYGAWTNWRAEAARAGSDILAAVGVHVFDLLGYLAGADVQDVASLVDIAPETGMDQSIAAALRYNNGIMATATITRRSRSPQNGAWVWGTKSMAGSPASLGMNPTGRLVRGSGAGVVESNLPLPDLYAAQFEAFAHALATGAEPNASGLDGLRSVALSRRLLAGR
jgi:1,5-anhydro-D-fructose reductase (1,5-anhydro-D-mannitol-forming)